MITILQIIGFLGIAAVFVLIGNFVIDVMQQADITKKRK